MKKFKIKRVRHVRRFFEYLYNDLSLSFHPDDDFKDYVYNRSGKRMFTGKEARYYNRVMSDCFCVCSRKGIDLYEICTGVFYNDVNELA